MKKINLGGDIIGRGSKMNVGLDGYGRSTHNLNRTVGQTETFGLAYPIHTSIVLAGDTREIELDMMKMTHPTNGPLLDTAKCAMYVFSMDVRLVIAKLHMNYSPQNRDLQNIKLPQIKFEANKIDWSKDPSNQQTSPSSIWRCLDIAGAGDTTDLSNPVRYFSAVDYLMYWDIMYNYFINKQEKEWYVVHASESLDTITSVITSNPSATIPKYPATTTVPITNITTLDISYTGDQPQLEDIYVLIGGDLTPIEWIFSQINTGVGTIACSDPLPQYIGLEIRSYWVDEAVPTGLPKMTKFPIENIQKMKEDILHDIKNTGAYIIDQNSIAPYGLSLRKSGNEWAKEKPHEGLCTTAYMSDLLQNWLNGQYIDQISQQTAVQVDGTGKFTFDNFLMQEKLYNYKNRIAITGGTIAEMMEVIYDVSNRTRPEIPIFEGGMSTELVWDQLLSTAPSAQQPIGTIVGRGKLVGQKGGTVRIHNDNTQHMMYMVIAVTTPRINYSQGNDFRTNLKTYEDYHKPQLDGIGYQDLITDKKAYFDTKVTNTGAVTFFSSGKQPAWSDYQTEINKVRGNFATGASENWMVFDRNYGWDEISQRMADDTTAIDPSKFNNAFSYAALDADNIWAQYSVKDKAIRTMSANQIPKIT